MAHTKQGTDRPTSSRAGSGPIPRYRADLPQLGGDLYLTDGGIETTLIFHEGLDLPHFAAYPLLRDEAGTRTLEAYFRRHAEIARERGLGFVLESATWRASPDWAAKLGDSKEDLATANRRAIELLSRLRDELESEGAPGGDQAPMVISGCLGPRGDGYDPSARMTPEEAEAYHAFQVEVFAGTAADLVTAITMTHAEEAIGIVRAARRTGLPVVIAFTTETDGRLPTGQPLAEAIREVDAATDAAAAYYMVNCAHPSHFAGVLGDTPEGRRIRGIRANASRRSHAELDAAPDLDEGDPAELGADYASIRRRLPWVNVLGGCCGTDHRHVEAIARACLAQGVNVP